MAERQTHPTKNRARETSWEFESPSRDHRWPVNMNVIQNVVARQRSSGPGLLLRAVWFLFIGWWRVVVAIVGVVGLVFLALFRPDIGFTIYFP